MNAVSVYGANIAFTTGVNHQVTVGSNLQLCVNPGTYFAMMGGPACRPLSDFLGAPGLGGNLQFTIGASTTINWGRQYHINMGGETINYDASIQTPASQALCAIIGATCMAYSMAYGACPDEDDRAALMINFQATVDSLLAAFMAYQAVLKAGTQAASDGTSSLYGFPVAEHSSEWELGGMLTASALTELLASIITPVVEMAVEESHFASQPSQTQSAS
ncbi:MAG: hypothetical protein ABSF22_06335 [Bryobacteraceae bacterium]